MDLNFYSDLSDGTGQHGDSEFLDSQSYNGYDSVNKVNPLIPKPNGTLIPSTCQCTDICVRVGGNVSERGLCRSPAMVVHKFQTFTFVRVLSRCDTL